MNLKDQININFSTFLIERDTVKEILDEVEGFVDSLERFNKKYNDMYTADIEIGLNEDNSCFAKLRLERC